MVLISACFLGIHCRYNGESKGDSDMLAFLKQQGVTMIPVCPEQLGGLATPRDPSEIVGDLVLSNAGEDVTEAFELGAEETLKVAKLCGCKIAILKESSPSCGSHKIYDGTFSGVKIPGRGITAALLADQGIKVFSEEDYRSYHWNESCNEGCSER